MRLNSPATQLFVRNLIQSYNMANPPLIGESSGDRWIPRIKGPVMWKMIPWHELVMGPHAPVSAWHNYDASLKNKTQFHEIYFYSSTREV